jgi:membrane fusion protein, multidrug efflux system
MKRILLAALLVVLVAAGYIRGYLFEPVTQIRTARPAVAQPVIADLAVETPMPIQIAAIGNVQSIATAMVKSLMDGAIARVHFEEGEEVEEGKVLFTLDDRVVQAQLRQAQANLERDRAQLERFHLEVRRQTTLANRGVSPQQKVEEVTTSEAVYEAAVHAGEAAVENARVNLAYMTIRAPITGRTGSISFKRGNVVKAVDTFPGSMPLVTITQMRPIYVAFTVPERHLADIRAALARERLSVVVTVSGQLNNPVIGALTFLDNQVDASTGTIALKATFANDDMALWPGQFVNVKLTLAIEENALAVPSAAVQLGQNGPYIFIIKPDSTVELRLVRVGRAVDDRTVIAEGLVSGEHVVVDGQLRLTNGTRVAIRQPAGAPVPMTQPLPVAGH